MTPQSLLQSLRSVRRQVRWLSVARGLGLLLAAIVGLGVGVVALDYLLNLPPWPRVTVMVAGAAVAACAAARWVWRPATLQFGLGEVAGRVERVFPRYDDRLRSAVAFMQADVPGSPVLKQRVIDRATELSAGLDFAHVVVARPAMLALLGAAAAVLCVALIGYFATPTHASVAFARLVSPFAEHPWPKRQQIDLVGDVPTRVPAGQRLETKMRLARGDKPSLRAVVFSQLGDGPVQQQLMQRGPDGTFSAAVDTQTTDANGGASQAMKVWIRSGDDEVHLPPVTVVRRLAIRGVEASITPPSYVAGGAAQTVNLAVAPAVAAVGSEVRLAVTFNKPLRGHVALEPVGEGAARPETMRQDGDGAGRTITFAARQSIRFHVRGTDEDGFANPGVEEFELIVRPDQAPSIQIEHPRRNEERTAEAMIPLEAVAEDDYGLERVNLVVERLGDKKRWEIPLVAGAAAARDGVGFARVEANADRLRYRLAWNWELGGSLDGAALKSGDVLEYFLQAADNYYLDGQRHEPVNSGRLRVTIIGQEELTARVMDDLRFARGQIGEVDKAQTRIRTETAEFAGETRDKPEFDLADRTAAERLAAQQSTAASQAKQLAGRLDAIRQRLDENRSQRQDLNDLAREVGETLSRAAEGSMKDAAQQVNSAVQRSGEQEERNRSVERAQSAQAESNRQLQSAMDRLGDLGGLQQSIESVKRLLEEQQKLSEETRQAGKANLGKKPEQIAPEEREKLNRLADQQQQLADRTAAAIAEMQKQAEAAEKTDPASAEAMRQAANAGQQQQVSPNQQKAAQSTRQNQQQSAQSAQSQAELGLSMMLQNLRDAERRKLAELQKQLADLQKQIRNLVRRQAGHNLDNLQLQGPDKLAAVDAKVVGDLMTKAQRKPDAPPPTPTAAQLSTGQEQTERNTRDIARDAEAAPEGAEVAARLTRAAGRMERANVLVRQADLPAAYDPPQVEALAALEEAARQVDEMKEAVDKKVEQEKRELIRAAYARIKDAQVKLNAETSRLEQAPRRDDGSLRREDLIRLGQLPGEQGKLADDIRKLEERLEALQSIVYVWANKDIARSMDSVKDRLGGRRTDRPTQVEQARVVRQLERMIESLQENPIDSQFAQDGGGGGGGGQQGGQPRLPGEAELRLLKGLQTGVNDATQQLAELLPKDDPSIQSLGERQGEMRKLLSDLLEASSQGQIVLGPEPDPREKLPEEAGSDDIEDDELMKDLLAGDAGADADMKQAQRVGQRMGRARQRLALDLDPGRTTQLIQQKILEDMDVLIEQSRRQQAQARNAENQGQPSEAETKRQPRPGEAQAQADNQGGQQPQQGNNPADQSANAGGGGGRDRDRPADIKESLREWGGLSPRQREAVIEGSSESVIEAYRKLVDDYYRSLATKATEKK